jgi:hypothetical protein
MEIETHCIPLRYTYLFKPTNSVSQQIIYETCAEGFWRKIDSKDTCGQFAKTGSGTYFVDCLPGLRSVVDEITTEGDVRATLNEDRVLENILTITLHGPVQAVNQNRAKVYRSYYRVERYRLDIDKSLLYNDDEHLNQKLFLQLEEIADYCSTAIFVTTNNIDKIQQGFDTENNDISTYEVLIYGDQDSAKLARLKVTLLMAHVQDLFVVSVALSLSLQPVVAGPRLANINAISERTRTSIYLMDTFPEILAPFQPQPNHTLARNLDEIYIVGREPDVRLAEGLLREVTQRTQMVAKDCVMAFIKIDLLNLHYRTKICDIMCRYGTFIQLPYLGACRSLVRVMGTNASSVEVTITELMDLATELYDVQCYIHTAKSDDTGFLILPHIDMDSEYLERIAAVSGAYISTCENTSFEINGHSKDCKRALSLIKELAIWDNYHHQIRYRVELSIGQKNFITGKKFGKLHRIMSASKACIRLLPFNDHNFYIELAAAEYGSAVSGIQLLEDELPAEISFYIPDTYHRQAIGTGGQRVQSVMRKHNVFIKFGTTLERYPNAIAAIKHENVLIRCPSKNSKNIALAKQELLDAVDETAHDQLSTFIRLSRSHRRIILSEKCDLVREIEAKTTSIINFPDDESEFGDLIEIRGMGATSEDAARLLKTSLPDDYEFRIAYSTKFANAVNETCGDFYTKIVIPFRIALHMEIQVIARNDSLEDDAAPPYHRIVLSFLHENSGGLDDAIQELTSFLRERELDIIDRGEVHDDLIEPGTAAASLKGRLKLRHGVQSSRRHDLAGSDYVDDRHYDENDHYLRHEPSSHGDRPYRPGPSEAYSLTRRPSTRPSSHEGGHPIRPSSERRRFNHAPGAP